MYIMRNFFEKIIIYLKEDLKISDACKTIKNNLLQSLTDYFSEDLTSYFYRENPNIPFAVNPTDPTQVAALKKILNAFENAEKSFKTIETINISQDTSTRTLITNTLKTIYKAINELYQALHLLNHSSADIQDIVAPHIQKIIPHVVLVSQALEQVTPEYPEETVGAMLGKLVEMLPKQPLTEKESLRNLSHLIYDLPHYFEQLQNLIPTRTSGITSKSFTSAEEYQAAMKRNAQKLQKNLVKLNKRGGLIPCFAVIKRLIKHSADLVDTAAPLSKQAYLDAVIQLEEIKHNILPQLISELENVEESMALKPGLLTRPVLEHMDQYYTQLANQVNYIATAAGIIDNSAEMLDLMLMKFARIIAGDCKKLDVGEKISPKPNLNVLMDDQFKENRRKDQIDRLNKAKFTAADPTVVDEPKPSLLEVANRFFDRINSYYASYYKWSLANLGENEKKALITDYKKIQPHFAAHHPDIDKLIVDALTKPENTNIVSRLWTSEYKQLWGANQFKSVSNCKTRIIESIAHDSAQTLFRVKLIEKTIEEAERSYEELHNEKEAKRLQKAHKDQDSQLQALEQPKPLLTDLVADVAPFRQLSLTFEDNKKAQHYHQQGINVSNQITELEQAKASAIDFFKHLTPISPLDNPLIITLDAEKKELLRHAYKKFQSQFIAMGSEYKEVNDLLVSSLTSESPSKLTVGHLAILQKRIIDNLDESISILDKDKKDYFAKERDVQQEEEAKAALIPRGTEFARKTLLGHINELNLSKSIDDFLKKTLTDYLKDNLSSVVWMELSTDGKELDLKKLPYLSFHKDIPEVVMYKKLINAVYHMKIGLEKLESLDGESKSIINRLFFAKKFYDSLIYNIIASRKEIIEAGENPALKEIIREGLDLLEPLKKIPLIGDYLSPAAKPEAKPIDIIEEWQKQQDLVRRSRSSIAAEEEHLSLDNTSDTETQKPPVTNNEPGYLQLIASLLYKIPVELDKHKKIPVVRPQEDIDANINQFIDDLSDLSCSPETLQKILKTTSKLQKQLSEIGSSGRELTLSYLKEIQAEYSTILLEASDSIEFNLGLKPGTYSNSVMVKFNQFYTSLIENLPIEEEQTALKLLIDPTSIQKRLVKETIRLQSIEEDSSAAEATSFIFNSEKKHQKFSKFFSTYERLKEINKKIEDRAYMNQYEDTLTELKSEADKEYKKIFSPQNYTVDLTEDLLTKCSSEEEIENAMKVLFQGLREISVEYKHSNPNSPFNEIRNLYLEDNFSNKENQEQFLKNYALLQPFLHKFDKSYTVNYFLRSLQSAKDFQFAAKRITDSESKLLEVIEGLTHTKDIKKKLCIERINYLNHLLQEQEKTIGPRHIETFKENLFSSYIQSNVKSLLVQEIGEQDAPLYLQLITPAFVASQKDILDCITIEHNIPEKIAEAIDSRLPQIREDQKEALKDLIFYQHVNTYFRELIEKELGSYTDLFLKEVAWEFDQYKNEFKDINLTPEIGSKIRNVVKEASDNILIKFNDLKTELSILNKHLKEISELLKEECDKPKGNPCRKEKIRFLTNKEENLHLLIRKEERKPQNNANLDSLINSLKEINSTNQQKVLDEYDALINRFDLSNSLKNDIENHPSDFPQIDQRKLDKIRQIQKILLSSSKDTSVRLVQFHKELNPPKLDILRTYLKESFKIQFFENHINTKIETDLKKKLGILPVNFLREIKDTLMSSQDTILHGLKFENIENELPALIEQHRVEFEKNHEEFMKNCMQLHAFQIWLDGLINTEQSKIREDEEQGKENECRKNKIDFLEEHKAHLQAISILSSDDLDSHLADKERIKSLIKQHDIMININEQLQDMKKSLNNDRLIKPESKSAKLDRVKTMERFLLDQSDIPIQRLNKVKNYGLSNECKSTLFKNADYSFTNLCKKLISSLLSIIPLISSYFKNQHDSIIKDSKRYSMFKSTLKEVEEPTEEQASAQKLPEFAK